MTETERDLVEKKLKQARALLVFGEERTEGT